MAFDLSKWFPMSPFQGPPLPKFLNISWPWVKSTGTGIQIEIYDSNGNLVGSLGGFAGLAALALNEGASYTVKVTGANTSTRGGAPTPAILTVHAHAAAGTYSLLADVPQAASFGAGETKAFNFTMAIPIGAGGSTGTLTASIDDPNGISLATGSLDLNIVALPIQYGATITVG